MPLAPITKWDRFNSIFSKIMEVPQMGKQGVTTVVLRGLWQYLTYPCSMMANIQTSSPIKASSQRNA